MISYKSLHRFALRRLLAVGLIACLFTVPSPAIGQNSVRTLNPPVVKIELGDKEPVPPGLAAQLAFGEGGAGNPIGPRPQPLPYWLYFPNNLDVGGVMVACGYANNQAPVATLTLPSGRQTTLPNSPLSEINNLLIARLEAAVGKDVMLAGLDDNCFGFVAPFGLGSELGLYTVTLTHSQGALTRTWAVDYPYCRNRLTLAVEPRARQELLMGFDANQALSVNFYASTPDNMGHEYVATRNVSVGADGTLLMDISLTRSASYSFNDAPFPYRLAYRQSWVAFTFTVYDPTGTLLYADWSAAEWLHPPDKSIKLPALHPSRYPTLYNTNVGAYETCAGSYGRFAQTEPHNGDSIHLYRNFNDTTQVIGELPAGIPVEVFEERPGLGAGRADLWYRVGTEDAKTGWIFGWNLTKIAIEGDGNTHLLGDTQEFAKIFPTPRCSASMIPRLLIGQWGRVVDKSNVLRAAPDKNSAKLGVIPVDGRVPILDGPQCAPNGTTYWKVSYHGQEGWTGEGDLTSYWIKPE